MPFVINQAVRSCCGQSVRNCSCEGHAAQVRDDDLLPLPGPACVENIDGLRHPSEGTDYLIVPDTMGLIANEARARLAPRAANVPDDDGDNDLLLPPKMTW